MVFLGLFAGIVSKVIGLFGTSALNGVFSTLNNKMTQETARQGIWATALTNAVAAEVQQREIASRERVALWGSLWYRLLVYVIIAPPATYIAAVYIDTIFQFSWKIPSAPARFEDWGFTLLMTFIGGGSAVSAVVGAAKQFRK